MLIQNGCYMQNPGYYPDPMYVPLGTQAPLHMDEYYAGVPTTAPSQYQYQTYPQRPTTAGYDCACPAVPPQQSLLHQILTGKGYKNDVLCIGQMIKMETYPDFPSQNCCYSNILHDGFAAYPHMHRY